MSSLSFPRNQMITQRQSNRYLPRFKKGARQLLLHKNENNRRKNLMIQLCYLHLLRSSLRMSLLLFKLILPFLSLILFFLLFLFLFLSLWLNWLHYVQQHLVRLMLQYIILQLLMLILPRFLFNFNFNCIFLLYPSEIFIFFLSCFIYFFFRLSQITIFFHLFYLICLKFNSQKIVKYFMTSIYIFLIEFT